MEQSPTKRHQWDKDSIINIPQYLKIIFKYIIYYSYLHQITRNSARKFIFLFRQTDKADETYYKIQRGQIKRNTSYHVAYTEVFGTLC